jgi:hypothetical protein
LRKELINWSADMDDPTKIYSQLPKRAQAVIDRLRQGETLCKSIRHKETGETELTFTFEPSGKRAGPKSAERAIECGLLAPGGDGLFDASTSQTWRAA